MNNAIKIVAGILILGVMAYFLINWEQINNLTTVNTQDTPTVTLTSQTPSENNLQAGGSSYLDKTGTFSMLYPNDYVLDESDAQHIRIYKTGDTQQGQTEMYDGVIMVFEPILLDGKTVSHWVDDSINMSTENGTGEVTQGKQPTTINGYSGYTYKIRGLGESTYIVLQKDSSSNSALVITMAVHDPENKNYQVEVDSILANIQILK